MAENDGLTPKRRRFVAALMSSRTRAAAARVAGISEKTAERWVKDAAIKAALAEAQSGALTQVTRQLVDAMTKALETLESVHLDSDNAASARVSAARAILDGGLKYVELVDLTERVAKLEGVVNGHQAAD